MELSSIVAMATNKLDPLLTPKTYGPAKGLRNKLCINKPHNAKPDPAIIDVIVFGNLISKSIVENNGLDFSKENKLMLPKHKSLITNAVKISVKYIMLSMNLDFVKIQIYCSFLIFYGIMI